MKNKIRIGLFALLSALLFASCDYPGYDDYVTEQLVSVTSYDVDANFNSYQTYNLYDTVVVITDNEVKKIDVDDPKYPQAKQLYNAVKSSVPSKYTFEEGKDADLAIIITLVQTTNLVFTDYGWWWYDYCYWYYWGCGYYPYYPYSFPVLVGSYTTGSVMMDMFDTKTESKNYMQPVVWTGIVRSLMTGANSAADVNNAIKDCFDQTIPFQK